MDIPNLRSGGELVVAGERGIVARREIQGRHRRYVVAFERTDHRTALPAPEHVELILPSHR